MNRLRFISLITFVLMRQLIVAQDIEYARKVIDTLASPAMDGRGYVNNGDGKAAGFIAGEFANEGLLPLENGYLQKYSFPMNTFPGKVNITINKKVLIPARDFVVRASTAPITGKFKVLEVSKDILGSEIKLLKLLLKSRSNKMLLIDKKGIENKKIIAILDSLKTTNFAGAAGLIYVIDSKPTWSVMAGASVKPYPVIEVKRESLPAKPKKISLDIESSFVPEYPTQNVLAYVKGSMQPDTFLVFTAHYDHLGRMGSETYFPGANDNASGTAMLLDLAAYYSKPENKPWYSMAFLALSGEEAGLHGANFCAGHPPFPLEKVKFLVNMDMVGTGSEGITMVNGTVFKEAYNRMAKINADNEYVLTVKDRGESCNSDHCPFYKKGVPAVFIYSMGKEFREYHNPDDIGDKLPLTEYNDIFRLIRDFMNGFQPDR